MRKHLLILSLAALPGLAAEAEAQVPCGTRDSIVSMLADKYRERPRAIGIMNERNLYEIFTSKTGSWTILITSPLGKSCVVGAGQNWEDIPQRPELTGL